MKRPRILVDARMIGPTGHGIGIYVQDLAKSLGARSNLPFEMHYLLAKNCPKESPLRQLSHSESEVPFLHPLEPWQLGREIDALAPALFHSPSFMSLWSYPCPHMQTVHDLNHLHYGSTAQKLYYRYLLLPSLKSARAVCIVSETGRAELQTWLAGFQLTKNISLVPNAISLPPAAESGFLQSLGLEPAKYFFCLSNPKPHKNVKMLEAAHLNAWKKGNCLPLVVNTPGPDQPGIIRIRDLSGPKISALFDGARAFLFPSHYEGFGRPPLEAALAGTFPIVSDIPVHREVLAGVKEAVYVSPQEPEAWEKAFLDYSRQEPAPVAQESRQWIEKQFSVFQLGEKMAAVYLEALA